MFFRSGHGNDRLFWLGQPINAYRSWPFKPLNLKLILQ